MIFSSLCYYIHLLQAAVVSSHMQHLSSHVRSHTHTQLYTNDSHSQNAAIISAQLTQSFYHHCLESHFSLLNKEWDQKNRNGNRTNSNSPNQKPIAITHEIVTSVLCVSGRWTAVARLSALSREESSSIVPLGHFFVKASLQLESSTYRLNLTYNQKTVSTRVLHLSHIRERTDGVCPVTVKICICCSLPRGGK